MAELNVEVYRDHKNTLHWGPIECLLSPDHWQELDEQGDVLVYKRVLSAETGVTELVYSWAPVRKELP